MSAINKAFKIRDTATGLFFSGSTCHATIGTRFVKRDSLDFVISKTILKLGEWPIKWEVVTVELSETEIEVVSPEQVVIDYRLKTELPLVLKERGTPWKSSLVDLFIKLRRQHQLSDWPFIGMRRPKYQSSWHSFRLALKVLNIEPPRIAPAENGLVLFSDQNAAVASRMADLLDGVWDTDGLRVDLAERFGVGVEMI
jgi:hypothetical protein